MLASFLLSLREGLEAALIVGIVLAALRKMDRSNLSSSIWQGVFTALGVSIIVGLALTWIGAEFEGSAEEIFEGTTMLIAAILLTWILSGCAGNLPTCKKTWSLALQKQRLGKGTIGRCSGWLS